MQDNMTSASDHNSSRNMDHNAHRNIDAVAARAHSAIDKAASCAGDHDQKLQQMSDELRRQADSLSTKASAKRAKLGRQVQTRPGKSLGLAFATGAACAWLLSRR